MKDSAEPGAPSGTRWEDAEFEFDGDGFTEPVIRFWRNYSIASQTLNQKINHELAEALGLTFSDFAVLVHLARHPEHRMRMAMLAGAICYNRSRTTQIISRLERDGYVLRDADDSDGRGVYACITESGLDIAGQALRLQRRSAAEHLLSFMGDADVARMGDIFGEVIRSLSDFDCSGTATEVFSRE